MRATTLVYSAAGRPAQAGAVTGLCRSCGVVAVGVRFDEWVRPTFTDGDLLGPGLIVCHACQFCFTDQNESLAIRLGRQEPQRMRNYSHFVVDGEWLPMSKADKRGMAALLGQEPAVAVIAMSGQKHLLFRPGPGWWQIEETSTRPCVNEVRACLGPVEEMYGLGASKAEIESGRYSQRRAMQMGLDRWQRLEVLLRPWRHTLPFRLAVFLAQKEEHASSDC